MRIFILMVLTTFILNTESQAQVDKRLVTSWIPTQWEIYNTVYTNKYWDRRDDYDYIQLKADNTFTRRYQQLSSSGTWKYNKNSKNITLTVTKPHETTITLKVVKLTDNTLVYQSSEESYKVTMTMKKGSPKPIPQPKRK
jgi:hypothetical protein